MPEIVARRMALADDRTHEHIELVGYYSDHLKTEPIMVSIPRALQIAILDPLWMTTPEGRADVVEGKCPTCGHAPHVRTTADAGVEEKLLSLPEK